MSATETITTDKIIETVSERIARLQLADINESRLQSLALAHPLVTDEIFALLSNSLRVRRTATMVLPAHRFEGLSRGRGWARSGRRDNAQWGERVDGGYRVGAGRWTVGGNDGFSRKGEDTWDVRHVTVGTETWTVAN